MFAVLELTELSHQTYHSQVGCQVTSCCTASGAVADVVDEIVKSLVDLRDFSALNFIEVAFYFSVMHQHAHSDCSMCERTLGWNC